MSGLALGGIGFAAAIALIFLEVPVAVALGLVGLGGAAAIIGLSGAMAIGATTIWDSLTDIADGPPGLVVDGQQRLSALAELPERDFEIFVSALVCQDTAELRRQFVLINRTRPLPRQLIYELLPTVEGGLPHKLSGRSRAAALTERLNFDEGSSLRGQIQQHTNPGGVISDNAIQRVIMSSLSDGMMRELYRRPNGPDACFELASNFYGAVQEVFADAWRGHKPKTSRLVHGAGIVAMGAVMEALALHDTARTPAEFVQGLKCLVDNTAWTEGEWPFSASDRRQWNRLQNTSTDIATLTDYLLGIIRSDLRARRAQGRSGPGRAAA